MNERQQALSVLIDVLKHKIPLMHCMSGLTPFAKELCFGVCRHLSRLEVLAECLLKKRPKELEIWIILLLGLYQLHYLSQPDYAVVQETVRLLTTKKTTWAKGLVNAVLRNYCRNKADWVTKLANNPAYQHGHPDWLLQRIQQAWPTDWECIVAANDMHPPMSLRVNTQQTDAAHYLLQLSHCGITATHHTHAKTGLTLNTPCDVQQLPHFNDGMCSVQDEAAQLAVDLLDLKPGLRVLDACCAPGSKTCHILECEPHLDTCIGLDIDAKRLMRVQDNLSRLKLNATLVVADASQPNSWWDNTLFDRILLDTPCSATGVIRRHPDIKWLRREQDIQAIIKTQAQLLEALWPLLKPSGRLVYATCSIFPDENHNQLAHFIKLHPDAFPVNDPTLTWGRWTGLGRQILPGENNMDGFFYGVLEKCVPI